LLALLGAHHIFHVSGLRVKVGFTFLYERDINDKHFKAKRILTYVERFSSDLTTQWTHCLSAMKISQLMLL